MGLDLIREMFANATKWKMNTVRIYAHTTDPEHPFMVSTLPSCSLSDVWPLSTQDFLHQSLRISIQILSARGHPCFAQGLSMLRSAFSC